VEHPVDGVFDIGASSARRHHIHFLLHRFLDERKIWLFAVPSASFVLCECVCVCVCACVCECEFECVRVEFECMCLWV
jgi:hypothetical protein